MAGGVGQAHLVVLALNLDQQPAEAAQQRGAGRLVVDEGAAAAVAQYHAAQHHLVIGFHAMVGQQGEHGVAGRRGEDGGHAGLFGLGTYQPLFGTGAQRQTEAVEQD